MMDLRVSKAANEDANELAGFLESVKGDFPIPLDEKVDISTYARKVLSKGVVLLARGASGDISGIAAGYANDAERLIAHLSVIVVGESSRGTGAAKVLLDAFEDASRQAGMSILMLETHSTNERAIKFYRKAGYAIGSDLVPPYGNIIVSKLLCGLDREHPNILLTSVGRRAYLVDWFKEALAGKGEVHVANSESSTPAFAAADCAEVCPLIYSEEYIPFLMDYVRENHIGALFSLFDVDIPVLASRRAEFARLGCFPVIASPRTAEVCNDKLAAARFLGKTGIATVPTYLGADSFLDAVGSGKAAFPAYVKPRWGMGSIGVLDAANEPELRAACSMVSRKVASSYLRFESAADANAAVIVQPAVEGVECGMDVMNGLDGRYRGCTARRKVAMRAGETDVAETVVGDPRFDALARTISEAFAFPGNMDVDVFDTPDGLVVLEMNARFGGGYPFSHMAGANLPASLVSWLRGGSEPQGALECSRPGRFMKEIELVRMEG